MTPRGRLAAIHAEMYNPAGFKARAPPLPLPSDLEDASSDGISEPNDSADKNSDRGEKKKAADTKKKP